MYVFIYIPNIHSTHIYYINSIYLYIYLGLAWHVGGGSCLALVYGIWMYSRGLVLCSGSSLMASVTATAPSEVMSEDSPPASIGRTCCPSVQGAGLG